MRHFIALSFAVALSTSGCNPNGTTALESDRTKFQKERDEYIAKLKIDLDRADRDIDALKEKAKKATGEAKVKIDSKIKELESHRGETHERYEELKSDTKEKWEELKTGMSHSWDSFKEKLHKAQDEFK